MLPVIELILWPILELAYQVASYYTARLLVPVFTLGNVVVEPLGKRTRGAPKLRRPAVSGRQPRVLSVECASLVGILFWLAVAVACACAFARAGALGKL